MAGFQSHKATHQTPATLLEIPAEIWRQIQVHWQGLSAMKQHIRLLLDQWRYQLRYGDRDRCTGMVYSHEATHQSPTRLVEMPAEHGDSDGCTGRVQFHEATHYSPARLLEMPVEIWRQRQVSWQGLVTWSNTLVSNSTRGDTCRDMETETGVLAGFTPMKQHTSGSSQTRRDTCRDMETETGVLAGFTPMKQHTSGSSQTRGDTCRDMETETGVLAGFTPMKQHTSGSSQTRGDTCRDMETETGVLVGLSAMKQHILSNQTCGDLS